MLLLTWSGGVVEVEDKLSAVPLELDSEVTAAAVLDLPRMKLPPVAATAVPDIAKNNAISEMTIAGDGCRSAAGSDGRRMARDLPSGPRGTTKGLVERGLATTSASHPLPPPPRVLPSGTGVWPASPGTAR